MTVENLCSLALHLSPSALGLAIELPTRDHSGVGRVAPSPAAPPTAVRSNRSNSGPQVNTAPQMLKRLPLFSKNRGYGEICAMPTPFANEGVRAKAETGFLARQSSIGLPCYTVAWTAPTSHRTYPGSPPSAYALQPSTFSSPDGCYISQAARITSSIIPPPTTRSAS